MSTNTETTTNIAALAPVRVEGWILFTGNGAHWIRDIDLAERAELSKHRDIRSVIRKAIDDGALTICDHSAAAAGAGQRPMVRAEKVMVTKGNGAAQEATEYYLSHEAALLVVMRLRTKAAVQLQIAISKVFVLAMQGRLEPPAPLPPAARAEPAPQVDSTALQRAQLIVKSVGLMSPAVSQGAKDAMLASAVSLLSGQPAPTLTATLPPGRWRRPAEMAKELGVTEAAIGRAITALGFREQAEHQHPVMSPRRNGEGEVVCYLWDETVFQALREHFSEAGQKRAAEKRAEADARVREGAGSVLKAILTEQP